VSVTLPVSMISFSLCRFADTSSAGNFPIARRYPILLGIKAIFLAVVLGEIGNGPGGTSYFRSGFLATISVSGFASGLTKECFCGRQLSPKYFNGF
jgi:hypothetical protein